MSPFPTRSLLIVWKKDLNEPENFGPEPEDQALMPENEPENCLKISGSFDHGLERLTKEKNYRLK